MLTTVVGSFPHELKGPNSFNDKLKNILGSYDPYIQAIKDIVKSELKAGVDIVADGGIRENMNMINYFSSNMPGMSIEEGTTVINSKIRPPRDDITINDIKTAEHALKDFLSEADLTSEEKERKAVKAVVTGPSTMIHSSRIGAFYKSKDDAILDYARSFNKELSAIEKKTNVKYIQIDEPMLSVGIANMKTASEAIDILTKGIKLPIAVHACGNLSEIFKDLAKFNVEILDLEFAGNDVNFNLIKNNLSDLEGKKIGFGCVDSSVDNVDDKKTTKKLMTDAVELLGSENILFDPDCGLGKLTYDNAYGKLELMCNLNKEFGS